MERLASILCETRLNVSKALNELQLHVMGAIQLEILAEELGIPADLVMRFAANFGGGMKTGALCGAVAGGVTVLALHGLDTPEVTAEDYARVRARHPEAIDCKPLLTRNAEAGREKKPFCDGLVYECVTIAEDMLREAGKIE